MEVITIESMAFKELQSHLEVIRDEVVSLRNKSIEDSWLTSLQVQKILGISQKTWQSYRDRRLIRFSQIGNKIFVKVEWLNEFLESHSIKAR